MADSPESVRPRGWVATVVLAHLLMLVGLIVGYLLCRQWAYGCAVVGQIRSVVDVIGLLAGLLLNPLFFCLLGPFCVAVITGYWLMGPGSQVLGVAYLLAAVVLQYALLWRAIRRLFWTHDPWQCWVWRVFLVVYSAAAAYALAIASAIT